MGKQKMTDRSSITTIKCNEKVFFNFIEFRRTQLLTTASKYVHIQQANDSRQNTDQRNRF